MPKLEHLLEDALAIAYRRRNARQKIQLKHGLVIELYITTLHLIHLLLVRRAITPSAKEWETVLAHWPWELPSPRPKPSPFKIKDQYCLTAVFPVPDVHARWAGPPEPPEPRSESKDAGPETLHEKS